MTFVLWFAAVFNYWIHVRRYWWAPIVGLVCQVPWIAYGLWVRAWGLVGCGITFGVIAALAIPTWARTKGATDGRENQ